MEINWNEIKVGEKYKYEEKYYMQAEVLVLEKNIIDNCYEFKLKVTTPYYNCKKGSIFYAGKTLDEKYEYLTVWHKFKTLDSEFDYKIRGK
jgi:hypothetical protein